MVKTFFKGATDRQITTYILDKLSHLSGPSCNTLEEAVDAIYTKFKKLPLSSPNL